MHATAETTGWNITRGQLIGPPDKGIPNTALVGDIEPPPYASRSAIVKALRENGDWLALGLAEQIDRPYWAPAAAAVVVEAAFRHVLERRGTVEQLKIVQAGADCVSRMQLAREELPPAREISWFALDSEGERKLVYATIEVLPWAPYSVIASLRQGSCREHGLAYARGGFEIKRFDGRSLLVVEGRWQRAGATLVPAAEAAILETEDELSGKIRSALGK